MAWKYRSLRGAVAIAAIGDQIPDTARNDVVFKQWLDRGYRCAPSMQGVLLLDGGARTTKKRSALGFYCVEVGVDEKVFWLLTHD